MGNPQDGLVILGLGEPVVYRRFPGVYREFPMVGSGHNDCATRVLPIFGPISLRYT